jgi:hypothetical protein
MYNKHIMIVKDVTIKKTYILISYTSNKFLKDRFFL